MARRAPPLHINPDKRQHDAPRHDKSAIWPLHPFRALLASPPGGGKRQTTLEIIGRHPKAFDTITVMHLAPKSTKEYEILGDSAKLIGEDDLPDVDHWDRDLRNLLVIDEVNVMGKSLAYKKKMDRTFAYASTHSSLSIIIQVQDPFTVPVSVRRSINHWLLWRSSDAYVVNTLGRRLGYKNLNDVFTQLNFGPHEHLWLDLSGNGPPLRRNISEIITVND